MVVIGIGMVIIGKRMIVIGKRIVQEEGSTISSVWLESKTESAKNAAIGSKSEGVRYSYTNRGDVTWIKISHYV